MMTEVEGFKCEVVLHLHLQFNLSIGIIYVEDIKIDSVEEFKTYIQETNPFLKDVTPATFIKTRSIKQVFTVEFLQECLP